MATRSRNAFFAALVIAGLSAVVWLLSGPRQTSPPFVSPFSPTVTPAPAPPAAAAAAATPDPEVAKQTPEIEVVIVRRSVRDYRAIFGSNPVGNNAEITRALLGANPRGAAFLERDEFSFNADGELLDHWSHPYFFHAITGVLMEVRSAGPDGQMFTADDIIAQ